MIDVARRGAADAGRAVAVTRWLAALVIVVALVWPAPAQESVWDALGTPGVVIVLRHSYAPGSFDPPDARLGDCATQRNLDDKGRAQARHVGAAFREHGIAVGPVLSSPRCRCLETARLAFGRAEAWAPLQGALNDTALRQRLLAAIRERIDAYVEGPPLVLVTHGSVVSDLTGRTVRMGEIVVLRRDKDGSRSVAGQLYVP